MTRSNNYLELRKMSNPIPINVNAWQMRSQKRVDDASQYDPGIMDKMDQCVNNSISPHSCYSISPSPSQSPYTEANRFLKNSNKHLKSKSENSYQQKPGNNTNTSQLLNENSQTSHFDVQSELESLFVNATLSDGTLASNMSQNDDNSNTSNKFVNLNTDDFCDIDMNLDSTCTNFNQNQSFTCINDENNNNSFGNMNKMDESILKQTDKDIRNILETRTKGKSIETTSFSKECSQMKPSISVSHIGDNEFKEENLQSGSCDPVLTQIALNAPSASNIEAVSHKTNMCANNNLPFLMNKRNLFNQNTNNDDTFLPSINISNLTANNENQFLSSHNLSSTQPLNFLNQCSGTNNFAMSQHLDNTQGPCIGAILKQNVTSNSVSSALTNQSFGPYSMSLPAYTNFIEMASNFNSSNAQSENMNSQHNPEIGLESIDIETSSHLSEQMQNNCMNSNNSNSSFTEVPISQASNYGCLSMSLPAYTVEDYMLKYKQQNNVQPTGFHQNLFQDNTILSINAHRSNIMSSPHLNKLLLSNTKALNSFNSDSNLSCTTTAVSSLASMASPLSSVHDDIESIKLNSSANTLTNHDDDYDELDSDDESINNEAFLDLMNKNRDTYFWQYNIQSKGPKTKKVLTLRNKDPHLHRDFFDPVYQLQTINSRGTSLNKLRKGDGNDVTPNSDKLFQLGLQIHDFIQKSYQINNSVAPTVDSNNHEKVNLKREKNKIASRACRLKKKAQHEANKLKLHGLNQEHKQLVEAINTAKELIKKKLKNELSNDTSLVDTIEEVCNQKLSLKVAGNTDNFVYSLMQKIENERMNNLPSIAKSNENASESQLGLYDNFSDDTLVNTMMLIDNNICENENETEKNFKSASNS